MAYSPAGVHGHGRTDIRRVGPPRFSRSPRWFADGPRGGAVGVSVGDADAFFEKLFL